MRIDYLGWGRELFILIYCVQMGLPFPLDVRAWLRYLVLARIFSVSCFNLHIYSFFILTFWDLSLTVLSIDVSRLVW